ncbi:MAG: glycosyltransferase family 2 protein [Candidatus Aenigmatarchaeota archaeon]
MKVFSLIPAYNEEKTIYEVVKRVKKLDMVPIVIDDCSHDKTYELAKKAGAIVLKHEVNKGKGEALKTGFEFLKRRKDVKAVVLLDADLQYFPEEALKLLAPIEAKEAEFVTGYRDFKKIPFRHKLGNFVWKNSFNLLFGTSFKDTNCGLIAIAGNKIKTLSKAVYGGYIIENALFIQALKNRLKIKQVPVKVLYKKKSGIIRGVRVVLGVLIFIIKEGIKFRLGKK